MKIKYWKKTSDQMIYGITMAAPAAYNLPGTVELNLKADRASAENLLSD